MISISRRSELIEKYKIRISKHIKDIIRKEGLKNSIAIARQFYPSLKELKTTKGYTEDPLLEEDQDIHPIPNIIHKYPNKLLVLTTNECPVYCRYCTRKRKTLMNNKHIPIDFPKISSYLDANQNIQEVILSGGDPFMLSNKEIKKLSEFFLQKKRIKILRYHTRVATSLPKRFNPSLYTLLKYLRESYQQVQVFIFHINHPDEISHESQYIFKKLESLGYLLYNQSVLLRKVNDDAVLLSELYFKLISNKIQPYYLHHLDKVEGSAHFYVPTWKGIRIMEELKRILPSYLLPRYVMDSKEGKKNLYY